MNWDAALEGMGHVLLFLLVFGMSATVDISQWKLQWHNQPAIVIGLAVQFLFLPLVAFGVVSWFDLELVTGLPLLMVASSPGGSYSNWWCSMFNADLALSVTMTAISTLVSTVAMPLNLYLYSQWSYFRNNPNDNDDNNDDENELFQNTTLQWPALVLSLGLVLLAIGLGLLASATFREADFNAHMNRLGNVAGFGLVVLSAIVSNLPTEARLWNRSWDFYVAVALPCVLAVAVSHVVGGGVTLDKPERVTVAIECGYQNVGIATTLALGMFKDDAANQAKAVAVPFYYGLVEAVVLLIYCTVAWKAGWTKAPKDVSVCHMLMTSYEVQRAGTGDIDPDYHAHVERQTIQSGMVSSPSHGTHNRKSTNSTSPHHSPTSNPYHHTLDVPNGSVLMLPDSRHREFSPL